MKIFAEFLTLLVFVLCVVVTTPAWALGNPVESNSAAEKNASAIKYKAKSMDDYSTTLVEFNVGSVKYRVPRNYLINPDTAGKSIPRFRVTYPGFEPSTESNKDCFQTRKFKPDSCTFIEFWIQGRGRLTRDEEFENHIKGQAYSSEHLPNGVTRYEREINSGKDEVFRFTSSEQNIFVRCDHRAVGTSLSVGCANYGEPLDDGNTVSYLPYYGTMSEIVDMDLGIITLIKSFHADRHRL